MRHDDSGDTSAGDPRDVHDKNQPDYFILLTPLLSCTRLTNTQDKHELKKGSYIGITSGHEPKNTKQTTEERRRIQVSSMAVLLL